VHGEFTGHLRRSTGAGTVEQTLGALVGKTIDPLAESGRRNMPRVRDRVEALPWDHVAHGLGTAEDPGLCRLWQEVVISAKSEQDLGCRVSNRCEA